MNDSGLKVAFAGTPEFAAVALRDILAAGFEVPLVLTQPDRRAGRGMKHAASPVKQVALDAGLAVDQPERLRDAAQRAALVACAPDVLVVAAYGLILPPAVLEVPRLGCVNVHASLLPRWRGAAPIHRALQAGDRETGITIMQMDAGLDTGPMLMRCALAIHARDTCASLHDRLAILGGTLIVDALHGLRAGALRATPQPAEGVTYASKVSRAEAAIDWTLPAEQLDRSIRAFNPFPGASATIGGVAVKIWGALPSAASGAPGSVLAVDPEGILVACGEGSLRLTELQKPGSRRLAAEAFVRGFPLAIGSRLDTVDVEARAD